LPQILIRTLTRILLAVAKPKHNLGLPDSVLIEQARATHCHWDGMLIYEGRTGRYMGSGEIGRPGGDCSACLCAERARARRE